MGRDPVSLVYFAAGRDVHDVLHDVAVAQRPLFPQVLPMPYSAENG